jgi:hypothetical protein
LISLPCSHETGKSGGIVYARALVPNNSHFPRILSPKEDDKRVDEFIYPYAVAIAIAANGIQ